MVKYDGHVTETLSALADPNRIRIIEQLSMRDASLSELAAPLGLSLPAITKHLRVLDAAGLITTRKEGRKRVCSIAPDAFADLEQWIEERRRQWERNLDSLGRHLEKRRTK